MPRLRLQLTAGGRIACVALNVLPVPGAGAIVAGVRNPHTRLLRNGVFQAALTLLGTWPLIVPGVVGFVWAVADALRIHNAELLPRPSAQEQIP